MFFILSKILYFLLVPFWWIVILFGWYRLSKSAKVRKYLSILMIIFVIVFTNPFLYRSLVAKWQPAPVTLTNTQAYEAGILLGGMADYDKNERGFFGNNADRFIQTANLYHRGIIKKIIVSGGTGSLSQEGPPEALFLTQALMANGVNEKDIIIEARSRNTYENAVYSKKLIDSLQLRPPFVLITSALHMKRSNSVFNKSGIDFISFPCDYKVIAKSFNLDDTIIPDITLLNNWSYFIKEVVGLYVYRLTGKA